MKNLWLFLFFAIIKVQSQTFEWVDFPNVTNGTSQLKVGYTIATDSNGNVYEAGFKNNYFYVSGTVYGNLFYRKYSNSGALLFEKTITGKVSAVNLTTDLLGNVYLAAIFKTSISFEGGPDINSSVTTDVPLVIKFDSNGTFIWNNTLSNLGNYREFTALAVDNNNNVYVGADDFLSSKIFKLSPTNGSVAMTIEQVGVQVISSISIDNQGNIYAAGSCGTPNSNFAGVSQPTTLDYSDYAVKYSANGVHQWTKYVETISCLDPQISAKTPENIYFSNSLSGAFAFGNLTSQGPISGSSDDIYISKLNSNGNFIWIREVPASGKGYIGNRNFLTSDLLGNVYFAGSTKGSTVWSPTISTTISGLNEDVLVLKYNSNGDLLFAKTAGSSAIDRANGIALDANGDIYISGMASGNINFDGLTNSVGTNVPFIAKIGETLAASNFEKNEVRIYPNPAQNELFISNVAEKTKGAIYSILGQKIKDFEIKEQVPIDIQEFRSGIYFILLENKQLFKFIKN